MNRRAFIRNSALISSAFMVPGFLKPFEVMGSELDGEKSLVIIQFSGGNDGLNMLVPYCDDIYYKLRPSLGIAESKVIKLTDYQGLNPNMQALKPIYDQGYMSILNAVGYPNPDRSHFRSMDIWQTASNANEFLSTGWLGRYLDATCPKGDKPYLAIELDDALSLAMKGRHITGMAVKNAGQLYQTTREPFFKDIVDNHPQHLNEDNLGYLYKTLIETYSSADYIYTTSKTYKVTGTYPNSGFASQLKSVSQFINSGLKSRVYYISLSGFDTHVGQLNGQGKVLETFSEGIAAFITDLKQSGKLDTTLVMAFSEFGRRVEQNASNGTDHGTANNVLLFGGALKKKGILNEPADLQHLDRGDLIYKTDFRSVYATILQNWLKTSSTSVLDQSFQPLDFI